LVLAGSSEPLRRTECRLGSVGPMSAVGSICTVAVVASCVLMLAVALMRFCLGKRRTLITAR